MNKKDRRWFKDRDREFFKALIWKLLVLVILAYPFAKAKVTTHEPVEESSCIEWVKFLAKDAGNSHVSIEALDQCTSTKYQGLGDDYMNLFAFMMIFWAYVTIGAAFFHYPEDLKIDKDGS